jgi:C4-dicarboxylate transporter DctM subunit
MDPILLSLLGITGMFILILLQVPIGLAMATVGVIGFALMSSFESAVSLLVSETVTTITSLDMAVIPLFLLMGNFANAAGISTGLYNLAYALMGRWRGGLAMSTVGACGLFGAVCGSSFATTATFGRIALPEMTNRNYAPTLASGCIAAGANLASLVPPSIVMIIYAIMAEQFIIEIFIAALIPAVLTILLYVLAIVIYTRIYPMAGPAGEKMTGFEVLKVAVKNLDSLLFLSAIAAGIYGGVFSVTEAAALAVVLSFLFVLLRREITWEIFWQALADAASNTAMIYIVIIGANVLNYFLVVTHMPDVLVTAITNSGWPTYLVILLLLFAYLILGSIFDTIAAMLITLPFVLPLITNLGYSLVWWGVINVVVIEIGLITPPIGMNVFVLQGISRVPLSTVFKGIVPFLCADLVRLSLLVLFPVLVLWLPALFR